MEKYVLLLFLMFFHILLLHCQEKPNIVLINIDDMGWKDVGFMGSQYYETPIIDNLAAQGLVFTNGYASAANCAPSRANLMSGKYPQYHGIYTVGSSERGKSKDRKIIPVQNNTTIPDNFKLLPQVLKDNGYETCHAGKWHISGDPQKKGFDINIGGSHAGHPASYYPPFKNVNIQNDGYLTDVIMGESIDFVNKTDKPFFLYYSPYAVHTPIQPIDSLLPKYNHKPGWQGQDNPGYATMVENLDRNIGLLISTLKKKGVFDNTIIIFTSDNGGLYGITKQKPLRAGKGSYYEGGIRVPFFFVWKGKIESGINNITPISNLDIFPTLLAVSGINNNVKNQLDGANLLPLLLGNTQIKKRDLFWHFPIYLQSYAKENENRDRLFRTRPGSVVRSGNWKLHYYYEDNGVELYNLKDDVSEKQNLALLHPKKTKELLEKMNDWLKKTKAKLPTEENPDFNQD